MNDATREPAMQGGISEIGSVLPDSGDNVVRNPTLELLCRGELAGEDEGIEAALIDDSHGLFSRGRRNLRHPFIVTVNVFEQRISRVAIPQRSRHIPAYEPRLTVDDGRSDAAELLIGKYLNLVAHFFTS